MALNFYDLIGNFSSFSVEYYNNDSSGSQYLNSTFVVIGTPSVNGAKEYEVNVTMSSGSPPTEQPPTVLVINSSGTVTSLATQGQNYTGASAEAFGGAFLSFFAGITDGASIYNSLQAQGGGVTVTIGHVQFQVVTYSGTTNVGGVSTSYLVKYGTPEGHQITVLAEFHLEATSASGSGIEDYQLTCASFDGEPTCPAS
ncbi:MAG: hypothetical protein JRN06_09260 [Nitrososphaerota archaeon]|nr:hypothetical protein [Nitrososphaerota archaeon]MDG7024773.1 hypothetical protein [Nitrososphaerota archaeon]